MSSTRSVAIVGAGPKGTYALDRLLCHHAADHGGPLVVDLWDPVAHPGAGPVYDPNQAHYLTMNQPAGQIDMWWPGGGVVPSGLRLGFAEWAGIDPGVYAPRAAVGRYLAEGLKLLKRYAPPSVTVSHRALRVGDVRRVMGGWAVEAAGMSARYHDVLLATGHNGYAAAVPTARGDLSVRGFALTFIDIALALSEGRGGQFLAAPGGLRYCAPAGEPLTLWPFSRTGRPMLPKPEAAVAEQVPGLADIVERGQARLRGLQPPVRLGTDLLPVVTDTVERLLSALGGTERAGAAPEHALANAVDIASGRAQPDAAWARGEVWRSLYPQIVEGASSGVLVDADRPAFRRLAARMERGAFGPSVTNAAKLAALVQAGVVRLDRVAAGWPRSGPVVDAVIAPPGIAGDPLLERLARAGHVRAVAGGRGVEVGATGTCVGANGRESTGLAAYGRPTEDAVVGNDTLSRTLHPYVDRWAAAVVREGRGAEIAA